MIEKLVFAWLKSKMDAALARETPIGGTVPVTKVARGIRAWGGRWELDLLFRRTD
jgi:hypothetical protein